MACFIGSVVVPSNDIRLITVSIQNPPTNKFTNSVGYILIVASTAINPAHHQDVAISQDIE